MKLILRLTPPTSGFGMPLVSTEKWSSWSVTSPRQESRPTNALVASSSGTITSICAGTFLEGEDGGAKIAGVIQQKGVGSPLERSLSRVPNNALAFDFCAELIGALAYILLV